MCGKRKSDRRQKGETACDPSTGGEALSYTESWKRMAKTATYTGRVTSRESMRVSDAFYRKLYCETRQEANRSPRSNEYAHEMLPFVKLSKVHQM